MTEKAAYDKMIKILLFPMRLLESAPETKSGGSSGESHNECRRCKAERPNLSGKRTEQACFVICLHRFSRGLNDSVFFMIRGILCRRFLLWFSKLIITYPIIS